MSRKTKVWLIIGALLIVTGIIVIGGALTMSKWNFSNLQTSKFETNEHVINEKYENISLVCDTADIEFVSSGNDKTTVICHEKPNAKHEVSANDGTLEIKLVDERKWYNYIGINFGTPSITVHLPEGEYGSLFVKSSTGDLDIPKAFFFESIDISASTGDITSLASATGAIIIKTDTGDVTVENVSAESVALSASTGDITASDITCTGEFSVKVTTGKVQLDTVTCKNITSTGNTGAINLKNVIAEEKLSIERSTGNVRFEKCDGADIAIVTDTGSISGTLLSEKIFVATSDTGKVNVPKTTTGGKCEISTDTGSINIDIEL
ncbi:MAG: DUF4097 domain-containing protein [Ruminococcaceae bacterium]|nr:DUF4097 domain-containing protein [Oscillospiraceae bacterium]